MLGGPRAYDGRSGGIARPARPAGTKIVAQQAFPRYLRRRSGTTSTSAGEPLNFARASERLGRAGARCSRPCAPEAPTPRYQVMIGPWYHTPVVGLGEWIAQLHLEWFDHWLRGVPTGLTSTRTPLHAFELHANRWIEGGVVPAARARVAQTLWLWLRDAGPNGVRPRSRAPTGSPGAMPSARATATPTSGARASAASSPPTRGQPVNPCDQDDSTTQAGSPDLHDDAIRARRHARGAGLGGRCELTATSRDSVLVATLEDIAPGR